jgi:NAD(P)-dependent dehydrogenase (short-subunit alcohol dehydrogenase family)
MGTAHYDFAGKAVLITGAARGIGAATAMLFAENGAQVAIAGRKLDALEAWAGTIRERTGARCEPIVADVTDEVQCQALIEATVERLGGLDILVNNVGGGRAAALRDYPTEHWLRQFDLNIHSAFYGARAAARLMIERGAGSIVNVSSLAGVHGTMGFGPYSAAKAGLQMLTRVAAAEWGPRGLRVNCVAAGMIATERAEASWAKMGMDPLAACKEFPLRRPGRPEEVGQAVLFLASEAASYITGETLVVGGGPQLKGMIDV